MKRTTLALVVALALIAVPASAQAKPTWLPCNPASDVVSIKVKPRRCTILPPSASFSQGASFIKLRWTRWGKNRAYFTGVERGFHRPYSYFRVYGFAFRARPDLCGGRIRLFNRIKFHYRGYQGAQIIETQTCVGYD
jgi:hypothetical protein